VDLLVDDVSIWKLKFLSYRTCPQKLIFPKAHGILSAISCLQDSILNIVDRSWNLRATQTSQLIQKPRSFKFVSLLVYVGPGICTSFF
jgi:hypothetical protein